MTCEGRRVRRFVRLVPILAVVLAACASGPKGRPSGPAPEYEPPRAWSSAPAAGPAPSGSASKPSPLED